MFEYYINSFNAEFSVYHKCGFSANTSLLPTFYITKAVKSWLAIPASFPMANYYNMKMKNHAV